MKHIKLIAIVLAIFSFSFTYYNQGLVQKWIDLNAEVKFNLDKQSFCIKENDFIYGKNINLKIKPASVTKLYTTLWSLDELGKEFRFQTQVSVLGKDLYIIGGSDPFFVTENLFVIMGKLYEQGYQNFDNLYFSSDFFLNWSDSTQQVSSLLSNLFNTYRWNNSTHQALFKMNEYILRNNLGQVIDLPHFSVKKVKKLQQIRLMSSDFSFIHRSSPIWQHLKQVNMYSNNFYTDKIFNFLGGSEDFSNYINKKLSANKDDIYFFTGSGLGNNYTTCQVTLKMLTALENVMSEQSLTAKDVIAIPGIDTGTLFNRFTELEYKAKLAAKTGTLKDTSSLAGYIFNSKSIKFAIFNHTDRRQVARSLQDKLIKESIDNYTNGQSINYVSPDYLSIRGIEIVQN